MSTQAISKILYTTRKYIRNKVVFRDKNGIKLTAVGNDLFKHIDTAISSIDLGEK